MKALVARGAFVVGLLLAVFCGWRIIVTSTADRIAADDPAAALAWDAKNPTALLALARNQMESGHPDAAANTAKTLLRNEPVQGPTFAILAQAAAARSDDAHSQTLREIALRRAPKNLAVRASWVDDLLKQGRYADALTQIDILIRVSTLPTQPLLAFLARLSDDQDFAHALAGTLSKHPAWRYGMVTTLLTQGSPAAIDQVLDALEHKGGLTNVEAGRWLDKLLKVGAWGEAYSRWASTLSQPAGSPLAIVHNGSFEQDPTGIGFDWQLTGALGATVTREPVAGAEGSWALRVTFSGRRVPDIGVQQILFMAPGSYRLRFRTRTQNLRSDKGLEWAIGCQGTRQPFQSSRLLSGNFDWTEVDTEFTVPSEACPAQRLWLRNPGAEGAGKIVSGTIWFDDISIVPISNTGSSDQSS